MKLWLTQCANTGQQVLNAGSTNSVGMGLSLCLETCFIYNMDAVTGLSVGKAEWIPLLY
jgi:hypothetical protein